MHCLIFGCGYLGKRAASLFHTAGHQVTAVTRNPQRAVDWTRSGWEAYVADITRPDTLASIPPADVVLFAVGFDRQSGRTIAEVYQAGLRHVLEALPAEPSHFFYISSTGVYGQTDGGRVNEDAPCEPETPGGRACRQAELQLSNLPWYDRVTVLRLAGIYGPGRIPHLAALSRGEPLAVAADGYLNLVHVDDGAALVAHLAERAPTPRRIYNVSDGHPVIRAEFYEEVARRHGTHAPRFIPVDPDSSAGRRALSNKRIDSSRLREDVDYEFRFKDYRSGLAGIGTGGDDG
jgi:nucleoside-diphosphate-sugar epimerase